MYEEEDNKDSLFSLGECTEEIQLQAIEYWTPRIEGSELTERISEYFQSMQCLENKDAFLKGGI